MVFIFGCVSILEKTDRVNESVFWQVGLLTLLVVSVVEWRDTFPEPSDESHDNSHDEQDNQ